MGDKYFSKIDLKSGYHLVPIEYIDACVTHYFGHSNDDPIGMCSGFQNNLSHEENGLVLPLKGAFLE